MYIAFKWLTGLALAMWIAMCIIDVYLKNNKVITMKATSIELPYRNSSTPPQKELNMSIKTKKYRHQYRKHGTETLHYIMFFAGAIAVSLFNKKNEIIFYTKSQVAKIDVGPIIEKIIKIKKKLKMTSVKTGVFLKKYCIIIWRILRFVILKMQSQRQGFSTEIVESSRITNILLLKKLKDFVEERKRLGQLLIAALHENRNLRIQYKLETMAKNRLMRHIEDTQKKVKENRSRYVNFQHLYLVTHQENMFLKARVRKLTKDKENVEKDLMSIINKVYKSKNNELKAFCTRFIVRTRENILDADISSEVRNFLERSRKSANHSDGDNKDVKDWPPPFTMEVTGSYPGASFVPVVSEAPKLKGLPGEYIWTIKDKDGIIEKLYEYDFESDLDNGDTIRRIREYSVYHDKDCLLDFSNYHRNGETEASNPVRLRLCPADGKFLTGSEAFQKFLQNNNNIVPPSRTSASHNTRSLLCV